MARRGERERENVRAYAKEARPPESKGEEEKKRTNRPIISRKQRARQPSKRQPRPNSAGQFLSTDTGDKVSLRWKQKRFSAVGILKIIKRAIILMAVMMTELLPCSLQRRVHRTFSDKTKIVKKEVCNTVSFSSKKIVVSQCSPTTLRFLFGKRQKVKIGNLEKRVFWPQHQKIKTRNRCVCVCWNVFQSATMMDDCTPYGLDCPVNIRPSKYGFTFTYKLRHRPPFASGANSSVFLF